MSRASERPIPQNVLRVPQPLVALGIWLGGIDSFTGESGVSGTAEDVQGPSAAFGMMNTALRRSSILAAYTLTLPETPPAASEDLRKLLPSLRECVLLSEALHATDTAEWKAWCSTLRHRLTQLPEFQSIVRIADREAERYLPPQLASLITDSAFVSTDHIELALILPRFAKILRSLKLVGDMLAKEEPLKASLLIFSHIYEQIGELTGYINSRLERFADQEAELVATLDAASYTIAVELKKVYSQELAGLTSVRPAPSVFSRIETSYALLNNSFQQIIASLVKVVDPSLDLYTLYPELEIKRDRSVILRSDLADLVERVQGAETDPSKAGLEELKNALVNFQRGSSQYLFFKDAETVERFVEEIVITSQEKDLVPILHRFGAYLETLFGQVSLRYVLADQAL